MRLGELTARRDSFWVGIVFIGIIMAAATLLVLDAALPGGLIEGSGSIRYAQTIAFTTLVMFQLFNVSNARSDERSAFDGLFANCWLWSAVVFSLLRVRILLSSRSHATELATTAQTPSSTFPSSSKHSRP
jgi:magnesium-transporting ATPase (P-type)